MKGIVFKRLPFRVLVPTFLVLLFIWGTVYALFYPQFKRFIIGQVTERLVWEMREICLECDDEYASLLTSGMAFDEVRVRIGQGMVQGKMEDFLRDWGSQGFIYDYSKGKVVFSAWMPPDLDVKTVLSIPMGKVTRIPSGSGEYFGYRKRFTPWNWDLVILKSVDPYYRILERVNRLFVGAGFVLLMAFLTLAGILQVAVERPIKMIIGALRRGEPPDYGGTFEFEYLSDFLRDKILSLNDALGKIEALVSAIPDGLVVVTSAGEISDARIPGALGDLFVEQPEVGGRLETVLQEKARDRIKELVELARVEGGVRVCEVELTDDGGVGKFIEVRAALAGEDSVLLLLRDITKRKMLERELAQAEEKFRTVIENALVGTYIIQRGRITYANPEMCRIFGYSFEELMALKDHTQLVYEEDRALVRHNIRKRLKGEVESTHYEFRGVRKDGRVICLEAFGSFAVIGGVPSVVGMLIDVTEKKEAEKRIREAEARYRKLFMDSLDVVFEVTPEGKVLEMNPAGLKLFGFEDVEEISDRGVMRETCASPEDWDEFLEEIRARGYVVNWEGVMRRRDGALIQVVITATGVKNEKGELSAIRGILRDVTELRSLERQLLHSQKMEAVGRLAGGIAHDINNYLSAILGFCEMVRLKHGESEAVARNMDKAIDSIMKASSLIKQLLAFSRKQPMKPKVIDLNGTIEGLGDMLDRLIGDDVELLLDLAEELCPVRVDPAQMEQVLVNLLVNARDAMPHGGKVVIKSEIVVPEEKERKVLGEGRFVCLSVSDTGIGIPEEIKDRIFDPFFTTKGKDKGSGLGLSTVYGIIEQSGGKIFVESQVGAGTTFRIYLPFAGEDQVMEEELEEKKPVPSGLTGNIVLVDDNDDVRESLEALLSAMGFVVHAYPSGYEAVDAVRKGTPVDLLVTDLMMPGMNGWAVAKEMKKLIPGLKVLFISGYTGGVKEGDLEEGEVHFMEKPFSARELSMKVMELLS